MRTFLFILISGVLLAACNSSKTEDDGLVSVTVNEPIIMTATEFRNSVSVLPQGEKIETCGKLCFYNGFLYISETGKGIHIIDNRKPSAPQNVGYIELPGNVDIAVKNELLYADALVDLVWFDVSDPAKPTLKGRLENIFPNVYPVCGNDNPIDYSMIYDENGARKEGVVTGWNAVQRRVTPEEAEKLSGKYLTGVDFETIDIANYRTMDAASSANQSSVGVNGSMSRFALYDKYLYTVVNSQMSVFDLTGDKPALVNQLYDGVFYEVETIFSYKNHLFLGMPSGMAIYSVEEPTKPEYCSWILHVYGCDPVVVDNDLAYVTVRSGNFCGQTIDELMVIDVKNVKEPKLIVSYSMTNPKGLGIDRETLFLCDDGLKVFKITDDPQKLIANELRHIKGMDGFDLIPYDNVLMMIADDGLYQYDYSNLNDLKPLSKIPIYEN
jgi:hypothetical protein